MTLFDITSKNIRRNFSNYFLFYISTALSIMIYFTFISLRFNQQIINKCTTSAQLLSTFQGAAIAITIFSAIFIWYSNAFFTKKRQKEIGLYSLMGVKKKQIGLMLFYENIMMGILALATGIFLGSLLSKLFVMLLLKLMGLTTAVKFSIPLKAVSNTLIVFAVIFLITSIHSYSLIYRFKLIELFRAEKKGENEPNASLLIAILSVILIIAGYVLSFNIFNVKLYAVLPINPLISMGLTLLLTIAGTYLLFSSLIVFIVKTAQKNKAYYYNGINMISTSQLLYRIKNNARTLATIAVLSATALTAIGATYSLYYKSEASASTACPLHYAYIKQDSILEQKVNSLITNYPHNKVIGSFEIKSIRLSGDIPQAEYLPSYIFNYDEQKKEVTQIVSLISQSTFNKLSDVEKLKEHIYLNSPEEVILLDPLYYTFFKHNKLEEKTLEVSLHKKQESFKIADIKTYTLINENLLQGLPVIVHNDVFQDLSTQGQNHSVRGIFITNKKDSEELTRTLEEIMPPKAMFSSFYTTYKAGMESGGLLMFIGAFLSLVFLLATGSIIYFKQLTEAHEEKFRYRILQNIGFNANEMRASLAKQMLLIFLLPLLIGIAHSTMALISIATLFNTNLFVPVLISIISYTIIYLSYYLLTVKSYCKIISI